MAAPSDVLELSSILLVFELFTMQQPTSSKSLITIDVTATSTPTLPGERANFGNSQKSLVVAPPRSR